MQVWELMAFLSKCPAGQEVWGAQGSDDLTQLETASQEGVGEVGFVELRFEVTDEE